MKPAELKRSREPDFHPKERLQKTRPSGFVAYVEQVSMTYVLLSGDAAELDKTTMFASADQHHSARGFLRLSDKCYPSIALDVHAHEVARTSGLLTNCNTVKQRRKVSQKRTV